MPVTDSCLGCTLKNNPAATKALFVTPVQKNYSKAANDTLAELRKQIDFVQNDFSQTFSLMDFIRDLNALHATLSQLKNEYPPWMIYSIAQKTASMLTHLSALSDGCNRGEAFQTNATRIILEYQSSVKQLFMLNQKLNIKHEKKDQLIISLIGSLVGAILGGFLGPIVASCGAGLGCFLGNKTALFFSNRFFKKISGIESELENKIDQITSKGNQLIHEIEDEDLSTVLLFN